MTDRAEAQLDDPLPPDGFNHDALLEHAIDRLVACRKSLPILRRGDLRTLARNNRIFPSLGSTFVECAPEPLFRQGIRELARSRFVGFHGIAYITAFTYPEVLADVVNLLDSPSTDDRDETASSSTENPAQTPATAVTAETFPEILCVTVATNVGVSQVRKELEAMRQASPPPVRRRSPVIRPPKERRTSAGRRSPASTDVPPVRADGTDATSVPVADAIGVETSVVQSVVGCLDLTGSVITDDDVLAPVTVDATATATVDATTTATVDATTTATVDATTTASVDETTTETVDATTTATVDATTTATVDATTTATVEAGRHGTTGTAEASSAPVSLDASGRSARTPAVTEMATVDGYGDFPHMPEQVLEETPLTEAAGIPSPADLFTLVGALETVPADTYDWAAVGEVAVALHALHRARLDERRRDEARLLRTRVHDLVSHFKETFDTWGLTATGDAASWSIDGLPSKDVAQVTSLVSSLVDAFAQWQDTHDEGEPPMLGRREAYRATLRSTENLIAATYAHLHEALRPRSMSEAPVNPSNSAPAPESRTVIAMLLREGHFGTAARLLRAEGAAVADAVDLAETMQRRIEFEFTRPLTTVRTMMGRPCLSLAILNVAKQLERDLAALVLQPPSQSVTHRQLVELFWNADVRLRQRHVSDFLGRMWNGIELAVRLRVELAAGRRISDALSALSWWNDLDPTSPIRARASASRHIAAFEKDGLMSVRGGLAILEGLEEEAHGRGDWHENERLHEARVAICALEPVKQLRNDSIVAHGTGAVSEEGIALSLSKSPTRQSELRIPPLLTGTAEIAWMYRSIMENLGITLDTDNPLLEWGQSLADAIQSS
jgi:hypothetical protein